MPGEAILVTVSLDDDFAYLRYTAMRYFIEQDADNIFQAFCIILAFKVEAFMVGKIGIEEFAAVGAKGIRGRHHVKDIIPGTRFFRQRVFKNLIKYLFANRKIGHVYRSFITQGKHVKMQQWICLLRRSCQEWADQSSRLAIQRL